MIFVYSSHRTDNFGYSSQLAESMAFNNRWHCLRLMSHFKIISIILVYILQLAVSVAVSVSLAVAVP